MASFCLHSSFYHNMVAFLCRFGCPLGAPSLALYALDGDVPPPVPPIFFARSSLQVQTFRSSHNYRGVGWRLPKLQSALHADIA